MAILCVNDADAQKVADRMVEAGILAIWNFTRQTLHLPPEIITQQVNLAGDLAVLSVRLAEKLHNTTAVPEPERKGEEIL